MLNFFKKKKEEEAEEKVEKEEIKEEGENEEEKSEFPPIIKYGFIGLIVFILVLVVSSSSIKFGVEPTFEFLGGSIAFAAITWVYFQIFAEYPVMKKAYWIFIGLAIILNALYLIASWTGEKVYEDESLWSPSIIAVLFFAVAIWGIYLSSGSKVKVLVSMLLLLVAQLLFVLTAIVNGDEHGVRLIFVVTFFGELILGWGTVRAFGSFDGFDGKALYKLSKYFYLGLNLSIAICLAVESVGLVWVAVMNWQLTNWQLVTTVSSCPTAWYLVYAVWGKKYFAKGV